MSEIACKYTKLRNLLKPDSIINLPQGSLDSVKRVLAFEINSVRRLECVSSLVDLIVLLEKRNKLTMDNIRCFSQIHNISKSHLLSHAFKEYVKISEKICSNELSMLNDYKRERLEEQMRNLSNSGRVLSSNLGNSGLSNWRTIAAGGTDYYYINQTEVVAIFDFLSKNLGKYWRQFGRELHISEGQLDEIELQYPRDFSSRMHKLLHIFKENLNSTTELFFEICRALERCKRRDLRRKVEDLVYLILYN